MASNVKQVSLSEVCEIVSSKRIFASEYKNEGIPFYRGKEISQLARGEDTTAEIYISEDAYKGVSSRTGPVNPGDILLTAVGTLGNPYQVKEKDLPFYFKDGNVLWLRGFSDDLNPAFLFYWLNSQHGRTKVMDTSIGSTQAALTISALNKVQISLPKLLDQSVIVETLALLDQKIGLNKAISKTLEDIAQTVFKSWFIDFDPVKAKMAGEKPMGMDDQSASLFPASLENSDGEEIPAGWRRGVVSDICDSVVNGSTPLRSNSEYWNQADSPWFKTGELSDNFLFESKESISSIALRQTSVKTLPKGSVLMAIYAAPTVGRLGILTQESTFNQACTGMVPKGEFGTAHLFLTLFNRRLWFNSLAIGAAQQNISKGVVENCPVVIAPLSVHEAFRKVADPIFTQIELLSAQNITLQRIRDSLLPRLISGELQIPEEMLVS